MEVNSRIYQYVILSNRTRLILAVKSSREPVSISLTWSEVFPIFSSFKVVHYHLQKAGRRLDRREKA